MRDLQESGEIPAGFAERLKRRARQTVEEKRRKNRARASKEWSEFMCGHRNPDYAPGGIRGGNSTGLLDSTVERLLRNGWEA